LVDLPRTIAAAPPNFKGLENRVTYCAQSFFDPLPAGADLYLVKSVLSDWPDAEAGAILRRCAEAARPGGRVVVLSGLTPDDQPSQALLMMLLVGGKDRTLSEFTRLAATAGLAVIRSGHLASGRFVAECGPLA
jgi:2,7-dihydroxy-5-methyl-1-naphthoate 7-O-methyltransferase